MQLLLPSKFNRGARSILKRNSAATNSTMPGGGTLFLKVIAGKLLRNTEFIGKMDPFLEIIYEGK